MVWKQECKKAKLKTSKRTPDCLDWQKRAETLKEVEGSQAGADQRAVHSVTLMTGWTRSFCLIQRLRGNVRRGIHQATQTITFHSIKLIRSSYLFCELLMGFLNYMDRRVRQSTNLIVSFYLLVQP